MRLTGRELHVRRLGERDRYGVVRRHRHGHRLGRKQQRTVCTIADTTHPSFCTGLTCAASAGDAITITAAPNSGFHFVSWIGGSCTGQHAACTFHAASDENQHRDLCLG